MSDLGTNLDAAALHRRLAEIGLGRVASELVRAMRPCARLIPRDGPTPIGPTTRLGGAPDLPNDVAWPRWKGESLAFLLQLRLEELPFGLSVELPRAGLLSFFYVQDQSTWGTDDEDRGSFQVLFHDDARGCVSREFPADVEAESRFREVPLASVLHASLPRPDADACNPLQLTDAENDALRECGDWALGSHQVGGHPCPVQNNDMEIQCAIRADGGGDGRGWLSPSFPKWKQESLRWQLLLQLDSDDAPGWMWGDVGRLYFWIHEDDLARCDFSRVWMRLQCC